MSYKWFGESDNAWKRRIYPRARPHIFQVGLNAPVLSYRQVCHTPDSKLTAYSGDACAATQGSSTSKIPLTSYTQEL